jgi:hypothetical protein
VHKLSVPRIGRRHRARRRRIEAQRRAIRRRDARDVLAVHIEDFFVRPEYHDGHHCECLLANAVNLARELRLPITAWIHHADERSRQ